MTLAPLWAEAVDSAGVVLQTGPQNPWDPAAEKGPSTYDVTHVFTFSAIQALGWKDSAFFRAVPKPVTSGWQLLNITTILHGISVHRILWGATDGIRREWRRPP